MRYPSIDILRMIAIIVMVLVHFGENLSGYTYPFTGFGAPLFTFLSGVSYRLWVNGQEMQGKSDEEISKVSIRRGLFVFGTGFVFNALVWLPEDIWNWDVLTFIGAALLLLNILRRLPLSIALLIGVLALITSPLLRDMADYPAYWENGYFECDSTLSDVIIGFCVTGYFPFLPWITYTLSGFGMASVIFGAESDPLNPADLEPSLKPLMLLGMALIATSGLALSMRPYLPSAVANHLLGGWTMFPPTIEYMLATIGFVLLLFGTTQRIVGRNPEVLQNHGLLSTAKIFSQYAFTIYVLHHIVHVWPLWIYGMATGNEPTYYWQHAIPVSISFPLSILFLAVCYFVLRWIGPDRRIGIEAWMRWLCD